MKYLHKRLRIAFSKANYKQMELLQFLLLTHKS
jgi:hypothetical protein